MSQLYVPDKVFTVCTDGMKKSQLKVSSQTTIKIAEGRLAATINDRFEGNFMCAKMVIAGAIIGAIIAAIVVAATILSGGTVGVGLAMAIGAAGAAGGAAAGASAMTLPSICSLLTSGDDWLPVHPKVMLQGQQALLEHSKIPCLLGGNVMIFYSEATAEEFTDLVMDKTLVQVGGIILGSALLSASVATVMTAGSAFLTNTKLLYTTFGSKAAFLYVAEGTAWLGIGYGTSKTVDAVKGGGVDIPLSEYMTSDGKQYHIPGVYEKLGVNDYADGKTIEKIDRITHSNGSNIPKFGDSDPYADAASIMDDHKPNISQYEQWEYEQRTGIYTQDGYSREETRIENSSTRNHNATRELNPNVLEENSITHNTDRSGTYVDRTTARLESGQQLHGTTINDVGTKGTATLKNAWPSPLEWAIDVYNIGMNFLLEKPIAEYEESLKEEAKAKAGITVIEKQI